MTRAGLDGPVSTGSGIGWTLSADGRYVAFQNISLNIGAESGQIVVKDTVSGDLEIASRASGEDGTSARGAPFSGSDLTEDGSHVCFVTFDELILGTRFPARVVVRELRGEHRTLVGPQVEEAPDPSSPFTRPPTGLDCAISDDGMRVLFTSYVRLNPDDADGHSDAYLHHFRTGETVLVSRGESGDDANGDVRAVDLTPDGNTACFVSQAPNLSAEDADPASDVFIRDVEAGSTTWVSRADGGSGGPGEGSGGSGGCSVSGDGRRVAFVSSLAGLDPTLAESGSSDVLIRDLDEGTTRVASLSILPDGTSVAGNRSNGFPALSRDGRYLTWQSNATNLDRESIDNPLVTDVFLRDLEHERTTLISRGDSLFGRPGVTSSIGPAVSDDGRSVVFGSSIAFLGPEIPENDPGDSQIFLRRLSPDYDIPGDLPGRVEIGEPDLPEFVRPVASRRGSGLRFRLSEFAKVTLRIHRRVPGRPRLRPVLRRSLAGLEGANRVAIRKVIGRARLSRGRYRLRIDARDLGGLRAKARIRPFWIQ